MGLAQQPHTDGQAFGVTQLRLNPAEGAEVIRHLLHIVSVADLETRLFVEQVGKRGLGALDLGREQGFLADGALQQPVHRWHQAGDARQTSQGEFCLTVEIGEARGLQRGARRRQGMGHKGPHRLAQRRRDHIGARAMGHLKRAFMSQQRYKPAVCSQPDLSARARRCT